MIIGGGDAGSVVVHELLTTEMISYQPLCIIDDDEAKIGKDIMGVPIVGTTKMIDFYVKKYDIEEILITMPSASKSSIKRIFNLCNKTGCKTKVLPGIYQMVQNGGFINALRPQLSDDRRKKADEAAKIVRLLSLLPLHKERVLM